VPGERRPEDPPIGGSLRQRRWFQERPSEYPWEQDGLDHVRRLLPNAEPYRAWATFSFTAPSGRINECDLLVAVPGGLYLLELKGHPGHVVSHGETWTFRPGDGGRLLTLRNPLHLLDQKTKELRGQLTAAARRLHLPQHVPRVEPAIFLSAVGLRSSLDEVQRARVYGRDGASEGLPTVWRDLLDRPPQRASERITQEFSRDVLPRLLASIGIRASTAHLRFGDDWALAPELLDVGPRWEDRLAERTGIVREYGRVRIYLADPTAPEQARRSTERAALREYQVLQGINHRGAAGNQPPGHSPGRAALAAPGRPRDPVPAPSDRPAAGLLPGGARRAAGRATPPGPGPPARSGVALRAQPLALPPGAGGALGVRLGAGRRLGARAAGRRLADRGAPDARFDSPRAVQLRLPGFDLDRLRELGRRVRDLYLATAREADRVASTVDDAYVGQLAAAVTGGLGGQVGVAPRVFLRKLVADVLDRVDEHLDFDPRSDYALTVSSTDLTDVERNAATRAGDVDLDLP